MTSKKIVEKDSLITEGIKALNKLKRKRLRQDSLEELNKILRIFLKEKYGIGRGLTTRELLKDLNKKRIDKKIKLELDLLIIQIHGKEYRSEKPIEKKEFVNLIEKLKKIIKKIGKESN